jgi:hypothetical protein
VLGEVVGRTHGVALGLGELALDRLMIPPLQLHYHVSGIPEMRKRCSDYRRP